MRVYQEMHRQGKLTMRTSMGLMFGVQHVDGWNPVQMDAMLKNFPMAPGMGDGIQAAKAGILEVADVFVVNKADREGADQTVRELKHLISLGRRGSAGASWRPPVICTVATRSDGIDELVGAIEQHRAWMLDHGELDARRQRRAEAEIDAIALAQLHGRLGDVLRGSALPGLAKRVVVGELDVYRAADELIGELGA